MFWSAFICPFNGSMDKLPEYVPAHPEGLSSHVIALSLGQSTVAVF